MNNKKENIISESLNNLNDADVEKISETVPALSSKAQKRILKKCMDKMSEENITETEYEPEIIVSGAEKYSKPRFIRCISTVAACFLAVIGITGMIFINRNMNSSIDEGNISSTQQFTEISAVCETTNQTASVTKSSTAVISTSASEKSSITSEISTVKQTTVTKTAEIIDTTEKNTEIQTEKSTSEIITELPTENRMTEAITEPPTENLTTETITELPVESSTTEPVQSIIEDDSFCGKYTTHENSASGNEIEIVKIGENTYHVEVTFYRIAYLSDGVGTVNNGVLTFITGTIEGCPAITAEITLNDDGCRLKIIESEYSYIPPDSDEGLQYYRITES